MRCSLTRKQQGLTLIELLLVITVLTVFAGVGISQFNKQNTQQRAIRTAQQIQLWSQAAASYYVQEGKWPSISASDAIPADFQAYVPVNIITNPWGEGYTFSADNYKFYVYTNLPQLTNNNAMTIAKQIINHLPSAEAADQLGLAHIQAEINVPGQVITHLPGFIAAIDSQQFNDVNAVNISVPKLCPHNTQAKLLVDYVALASPRQQQVTIQTEQAMDATTIPVQVNTLLYCHYDGENT